MAAQTGVGEAGEKGLRGGTLGFISGVVIGVASTAPGYSLAASLGGIAVITGMGIHAPAILLLAFVLGRGSGASGSNSGRRSSIIRFCTRRSGSNIASGATRQSATT